jgi:cytidyltransferase-like protein
MAEPFVVLAHMVGDLFHTGHVSFLDKARAAAAERSDGRRIHLVAGLLADAEVATYKRWPILTLAERREVVAACRLVDQVVAPCPAVVTDAVIDQHRIDLVVHGDDIEGDPRLERFYGVAIRRGIFVTVPYSRTPDGAVSTTEIIARVQARETSVTPPDLPE